MSDSFSDWACDPARTIEERFGAQLLIEHFTGIPVAKDANGHTNYEAERLWRKERALNPAYLPDYTREQAQSIDEKLRELKNLHTAHDDRQICDLSFLRFCPGLTDLNLHRTKAPDWSVVGELQNLKSIWVHDETAEDYRCLGQLINLETMRLYMDVPWPDLSGWEGLVRLSEFHFHGNVLALQSISSLPAVRKADINHRNPFTVPLRSLHELPSMPELRSLKLINTSKLDGIERYPQLVNLEIYGYFKDLTPLTRVQKITHLLLSGGDYASLDPLIQLCELRWLKVRNDEPHDYTSLAEMPQLHEVEVELCPVNKVEVAALNAGLTPWSETFGVTPPRALRPLRLLLDRRDGEPSDDTGREKRDWSENPLMGTSEGRWFAREINHRLNRLLGKGWGHCDTTYCSSPGWDHIDITRSEDIDLLRDIVETLRELIASSRYPWRLALHVDSLARYERDMDDIKDEDDEEEKYDAESERENWEYRQRLRKERQDFLARKHRLRLQKETGAEIRPEDFAPPPPPEKEDEPITSDGSADTGTEYDLGTELQIYLTVLERGCFVHEHSRGLAEMLLALDAEETPEDEA